MTSPFKVAIVGMASRFPKAPDVATFWHNIKAGVDATAAYPMAARWGKQDGYYAPGSAPSLEQTYCGRGGVVTDLAFDPLRYGIVPREVAEAEADQFVMLDIARDALADAGVEPGAAPLQAGVILGRTMPIGPVTIRFLDRIKLLPQLRQTLRSSFPSLDEGELDRFAERFLDERQAGFENSRTRNLVPGFAASRLANRLNLAGPSYILDAACASSLVAIENAIMQLQLGRCELMLAGGVHLPLTQGYWSMFTNIGALSRQEQIRPFDRDADGLLLGEGAGLVVLKPLDAALAAGDRIHAVIEGIGSCSDGRAESLLAPFSDGQVGAFAKAWRNAGIAPGRAGYIECHGTGMPRGDEVESESLIRFFGPHMQGRQIALGSVKSMIGHTLGAAGIASVIKTASALGEGILPPSLHCRSLRGELAAQGFHVPPQATPWPEGALRIAGVSAFGFGGINAHLVMSAPPERRVPTARNAVHKPRLLSDETVLALSRSDPAALLADLERGELQAGQGPCRLVLFDPTPERQAKAARIVARGKAWRGKQDIFFSPAGLLSSGGKLAFLFPGLGNQVNPDFRTLAQRFGHDLAQLSAGGDDALVADSLQTVYATDTMHRVLTALGVVPDAIAGHSLGEWIACVSSGAIGKRELAVLVERLLALQDDVMGKGYFLLAVWCGADRLRELLGDVDGMALAVDNCPGHSVVCGSPDALQEAQQILRANGILSVDMGIEAASHTPYIRPTLQRIRPLVDAIALSEPAIPLWSASLAGPFPRSHADIKELIVETMAVPVRFRELVARMHDEGFRVFVQIGNAGLNGFVADTLKGQDFMTLDASGQDKSTEQMLRRVAAGLFAEGRPVDFAQFGLLARQGAPRSHAMPLEPSMVEFHAVPSFAPFAPDAPAPQGTPYDTSLAIFRRAQQEVIDAMGAEAPVDPHAVVHRQTIAIDHERYPELYHHEIYQSHDGRPIAERSAVVPMTMMIELACELVSAYLPGRAIRAVRKVLSFRFIEVQAPVALEARIYRKGPDSYAVVVEDRFSCMVQVADALPVAPAVAERSLRADQPPPFALRFDEIYRDRWLFHGPLYQGVRHVGPMDRSGIAGVVGAAGGKGALLDGAFQLAGVWFCSHHDIDNVVLPLKIEKIELFAPWTALRDPARRYDCRVVTRQITDLEFTYDLELSLDGRVLLRVNEFAGRRFTADPTLFAIFRTPERLNGVCAQLDDGLFVFDLAFRSNWSRVMLTKSYLTGREIARVDASKTVHHRNARLRGVVAAKDALKHWLYHQRQVRTLFPSEIEIEHDSHGAPWARVRGQPAPLALSISHKPQIAAVMVGGERRVGVDVETVEVRGEAFEALNYDSHEIAFFDAQPGAERAFWQTLFWTAKEAWGKCQGGGLAGAPRKIKVRAVQVRDAGWSGEVEGATFNSRRHQDGHVISWVRDIQQQ